MKITYKHEGVEFDGVFVNDATLIATAKSVAAMRRSSLPYYVAHELNTLLRTVSEVSGLPEDKVLGKTKKTDEVRARYVFAVLAREMCRITQEQLALYMYRSIHTHSNVNTALTVGSDRINEWKDYADLYKEVKGRIVANAE